MSLHQKLLELHRAIEEESASQCSIDILIYDAKTKEDALDLAYKLHGEEFTIKEHVNEETRHRWIKSSSNKGLLESAIFYAY